jgi:hypothetical protein
MVMLHGHLATAHQLFNSGCPGQILESRGRKLIASAEGLTEDERKTLQQWTRKGKSESRLVERARAILMADEGSTNRQIAERLSTRTARVSKWRQRFAGQRLQGLQDAARSGKPAKYDESTEKRILTLLACLSQFGGSAVDKSFRISGGI